jgi:hypothetical protein
LPAIPFAAETTPRRRLASCTWQEPITGLSTDMLPGAHSMSTQNFLYSDIPDNWIHRESILLHSSHTGQPPTALQYRHGGTMAPMVWPENGARRHERLLPPTALAKLLQLAVAGRNKCFSQVNRSRSLVHGLRKHAFCTFVQEAASFLFRRSIALWATPMTIRYGASVL